MLSSPRPVMDPVMQADPLPPKDRMGGMPWVYGVALLAFGAAPVIGYLAPLGLWMPWGVLTIAILIDGLSNRQIPFCHGLRAVFCRPMAWFLLIPLLGLILAPWSLLPGLSTTRVGGLMAQMLIALMVTAWLWRLPHRKRCWVVACAAVSATAVGAVMVADVILGAPLAAALHGDSPYVLSGGSASRGAVVHALLLFPGAAALWTLRHRLLTLVLLAVGIAVIGQNTSDTAVMGVYAGITVGALLALLPQIRWLVGLGAVIVVAGMPLVVPMLSDAIYCRTIVAAPSIAHRLAIWQAVRDLIADKPVLGWGVDSARAAPGGKETLSLRACDADGNPTGKVEVIGETVPLHPHNGAMDLWFSLGGVGVLLTCWAIWKGFASIWRLWPGRLGAATVTATSAILFLAALLGYGVWQGWFAAAICLSLTSIALLPARAGRENSAVPSHQERMTDG